MSVPSPIALTLTHSRRTRKLGESVDVDPDRAPSRPSVPINPTIGVQGYIDGSRRGALSRAKTIT
jgi:hypothetical protein